MNKIYCGHIIGKQLSNSTSGGIGYAIAKHFISLSYVVYGVGYSSDFKSLEYYRITSETDLYKITGTKYVKCNIDNDVVERIISDLYNGMVCFFGLPCGVALVRKYIQNHVPNLEKNLFCVDLICHGPTYQSILKTYVEEIENKYSSRVVSLSNRYKNPKWEPTYLMVRFENGKEYLRPLYDSDFGYALTVYTMESCYSCKIKGNNRFSDLTLGDGWGVPVNTCGYNEMGTSIIISHTSGGNDLMTQICGQKDVVLDTLVDFNLEKNNPMYYRSAVKHSNYEKFKIEFEKNGLQKACKKCRTLKQSIRASVPLVLLKLIMHINRKKAGK